MDTALTSVVATLIGNLGIGGILVWYLWYNVSVASPRREQTRREEAEKLAGIHSTSLDKSRADFVDALNRIGDRFEAREKSRDDSVKELAHAVREMVANCRARQQPNQGE